MAHRLTLAVLAFVVALLNAQRPQFEVASVKHNISGSDKAYLKATPGRLAMTNISLKRLILNAYDLEDYQISGDPSWIASEHYDIQATAEGNPSVRQMEGPMLPALLEDRFQLTFHRVTRQLPVYELTIAKGGVKLHEAKEGACTPYSVDAPPPPLPHSNWCGLAGTEDRLNGALDRTGVSIPQLATRLSRQYVPSGLRRPIIDKSGLTRTFNFHLEWTIDQATSALPDEATGPSILTATQEQLGLKLESAKGPVEVMVIDHVEPPSGN